MSSTELMLGRLAKEDKAESTDPVIAADTNSPQPYPKLQQGPSTPEIRAQLEEALKALNTNQLRNTD